MKVRGFKHKGSGKKRKLSDKKYIRLVYALWKSCVKLGQFQDGSQTALRAFCTNTVMGARSTVAVDPDLMSYDQASKVISALKAVEARGKAKK